MFWRSSSPPVRSIPALARADDPGAARSSSQRPHRQAAASQQAHSASQRPGLAASTGRDLPLQSGRWVASARRRTAVVIDYRLLGAVEAAANGRVLDLGGQRQRALLAILLLSANEPVTRDSLIDKLWGDRAPSGAQHTLDVAI